MSLAMDAGQRAWSHSSCACRLRANTLRSLKRALQQEPLIGREANLLCSALMTLENDPDLDPRAVLMLLRGREALLV